MCAPAMGVMLYVFAQKTLCITLWENANISGGGPQNRPKICAEKPVGASRGVRLELGHRAKMK